MDFDHQIERNFYLYIWHLYYHTLVLQNEFWRKSYRENEIAGTFFWLVNHNCNQFYDVRQSGIQKEFTTNDVKQSHLPFFNFWWTIYSFYYFFNDGINVHSRICLHILIQLHLFTYRQTFTHILFLESLINMQMFQTIELLLNALM